MTLLEYFIQNVPATEQDGSGDSCAGFQYTYPLKQLWSLSTYGPETVMALE